MIYTVTFNPSVDYVIRLKSVQTGGLNRTGDTGKYAGGKGINVSRILNQLDVQTTTLGFCGGFTGKFIKDELEKQGISHDFVEIEGDTRINIKLKTTDETEINADGPKISDRDVEALKMKLLKLTKEDHVVFAGSVPKGYDSLYGELAAVLFGQNIGFTIDAEGEKLTSTLKYKPYLIKPNLFELEGIAGKKLTAEQDIIEAAEALRKKGAQNVLVTLGGDGAVFVGEAERFRIPSPKGSLRNSVGAGDSTVAGFLSKINESAEAQVRYAIACGSATAFSDDLAVRDEIDALVEKVQINPVEEVK